MSPTSVRYSDSTASLSPSATRCSSRFVSVLIVERYRRFSSLWRAAIRTRFSCCLMFGIEKARSAGERDRSKAREHSCFAPSLTADPPFSGRGTPSHHPLIILSRQQARNRHDFATIVCQFRGLTRQNAVSLYSARGQAGLGPPAGVVDGDLLAGHRALARAGPVP